MKTRSVRPTQDVAAIADTARVRCVSTGTSSSSPTSSPYAGFRGESSSPKCVPVPIAHFLYCRSARACRSRRTSYARKGSESGPGEEGFEWT